MDISGNVISIICDTLATPVSIQLAQELSVSCCQHSPKKNPESLVGWLQERYRQAGYDPQNKAMMSAFFVAPLLLCSQPMSGRVSLEWGRTIVETCASYSQSLVRDITAIVDDAILRRGGGTPSCGTLSSDIEDAYLSISPLVLEAVAEQAFKERSSANGSRNALSYQGTPQVGGGSAWMCSRDAFIADHLGVAWYRNGGLWFGRGHVCGERRDFRYGDESLMHKASKEGLLSHLSPGWGRPPIAMVASK